MRPTVPASCDFIVACSYRNPLNAIACRCAKAPNPVMRELCPTNEANRLAYNVPPGQVFTSSYQRNV